MYFFNQIFQSGLLYIFVIAWWFISLLYFILKPYEKIDIGSTIKRADLGAQS